VLPAELERALCERPVRLTLPPCSRPSRPSLRRPCGPVSTAAARDGA